MLWVPLPFYIPKDFGTVIIILHRVLHKTEAVHITNKRVAICPQEVKPTHCLLHEETQDTGFISTLGGSTASRTADAQPSTADTHAQLAYAAQFSSTGASKGTTAAALLRSMPASLVLKRENIATS